MSKQVTVETKSGKKTENRQEKIPDVEWLFDYSETTRKKEYKQNFLRKLLYRDWKKFIFSTFLYILQASPVWILPLITTDVIDVITYRPDGYITRLIFDAAILILLLAQNIPVTAWRLSILNKWMRSTSAGIKAGTIRKLQRLAITYHKEMEEGKIHSKFLRDVDMVETYYRCFLNSFIPNLIGTLVSVGIALTKSPFVTIFFALVALIPEM